MTNVVKETFESLAIRGNGLRERWFLIHHTAELPSSLNLYTHTHWQTKRRRKKDGHHEIVFDLSRFIFLFSFLFLSRSLFFNPAVNDQENQNKNGPNRAITQKWSGKINFFVLSIRKSRFIFFFFFFLNEKILIHYHFPIFNSFSSS